jgi:hypothetical protein
LVDSLTKIDHQIENFGKKAFFDEPIFSAWVGLIGGSSRATDRVCQRPAALGASWQLR